MTTKRASELLLGDVVADTQTGPAIVCAIHIGTAQHFAGEGCVDVVIRRRHPLVPGHRYYDVVDAGRNFTPERKLEIEAAFGCPRCLVITTNKPDIEERYCSTCRTFWPPGAEPSL
jgi:hypothetical protein